MKPRFTVRLGELPAVLSVLWLGLAVPLTAWFIGSKIVVDESHVKAVADD